MIKKQIPNLITLLNLFCGSVAVLYAVQGNLYVAAIFVALGIIFDFFDGFAARLLNAKSDLGLQLDSLADMVTSGLVPGIVMFKLLEKSTHKFSYTANFFNEGWNIENFVLLPLFGLLITLASCYRLANFNIDARQTDSFIGLPTPANTLLILSFPLILITNSTEWIHNLILNKWFLIGLTVLSSYLLNANLPLFSLKMKTYGFKKNAVKYIFILLSILALACLQFLAIPLIIVFYIVLSVIINLKK